MNYMNYIKNNVGRQISTFLFKSKQQCLRNQFLEYCLQKNIQRNLAFIFIEQNVTDSVKKLTKSAHIININLLHNFQQQIQKIQLSQDVIFVLGVELLNYCDIVQLIKQAKNSKLVFFTYEDQFKDIGSQNTIIRNSQFVVQFQKEEAEIYTYPKDKSALKEIMIFKIGKDNEFVFEKKVQPNTKKEENNPDSLIQTSFKLGLTEKEKSERNKVITPYTTIKNKITLEYDDEFQDLNEPEDDIDI